MYASRLLPALVAALLLLPAAGAQELDAETIQKLRQLFGEANQAEQAGENAKAIGKLQEILKLLPAGDGSRGMIIGKIGANYAAQGDDKAGLAFYKTQIDSLPKPTPGALVDPGRAQLLWLSAVTNARLGNKKDALANLEKAVDFGFWDSGAIKSESALKELRSDARFQAALLKSETAIGTIAFGLEDLEGKKLQQKDFAGKVLILDVWGTWCPPCRMEIPHFVKLQKEYAEKGFSVIGLTWERRPADDNVKEFVKRFAADNEINYPLAFLTAERLGAIPNLQGFPTTFFVDRSGRVRDRVVGYHDYDSLKKHVDELIGESAPKKSEKPGTTTTSTGE